MKADVHKASALGVASTPSRYSPYPQRGGYRGRGAPRGRGRGGFVAGQNRLDNRSRAVIIGGEGLNSAKQSVKEWYEGHGGYVEDASSGEGYKVVFPNRDMAERVSRPSC
jgi:RNA-binding protein 26